MQKHSPVQSVGMAAWSTGSEAMLPSKDHAAEADGEVTDSAAASKQYAATR